MFHRRAHGSAESFLVSGRFWRSIHDELWTRYARARSSLTYGHGWPIRLGRGLSLMVAAGLLCAAARWLWLRRTARSPLHWSPDLTLGLAGVGQLAVLLVMMAQFASGGGSAHSRYLFPFLPVIGCFVALAWACLPGNRRGVLSAAALVASVALAIDLLHRFLVAVVGDHGWFGTEHHALSEALPGIAHRSHPAHARPRGRARSRGLGVDHASG